MTILTDMRKNYNLMTKLDNMLVTICDLQSVTNNPEIIIKTNDLFKTINSDLNKVSKDFNNDDDKLKYATFHKLINGKKVFYEITERLSFFCGLQLTNTETKEKLSIKWEDFFKQYIPLSEITE